MPVLSASAQLEDCEAALALYRERMGRVLAERRELRAQLVEAVQQLQQLEEQAAAAAAAAAAGAGTGLGVLGGVSATMPSAEGMAAALQHAGSGVMGMGMELKVVVGGGGGGVDASHASLLRTDRHLLVLRVAELAGRMEKNVAAEGHTTALAKVGRGLAALMGWGVGRLTREGRRESRGRGGVEGHARAVGVCGAAWRGGCGGRGAHCCAGKGRLQHGEMSTWREGVLCRVAVQYSWPPG